MNWLRKIFSCGSAQLGDQFNQQVSKQETTNKNEPSSSLLFPDATFEELFKTVHIGNQIWMAKNLDIDHFRNNTKIPEVQDGKEWKMASEAKRPAWCYYDNDAENGKIYGKLYNWFAVIDPRGLAPEGWHVPSQKEFEELLDAVGTDEHKQYDALINGGYSGFNALLGGCRFSHNNFLDKGTDTSFWSSSQCEDGIAYSLQIWEPGRSGAYLVSSYYRLGFSVRCVKD